MHSQITILDTHVHIHDCFDIARFLDHAHSNFASAAAEFGARGHFTGVLLLTESCGTDWFNKLKQASATNKKWGDWSIYRNQEELSLAATSGDGRSLAIVAGRQIVTAENLEILALGYTKAIEDGRPIDAVISDVQDANALCVLPWGFGKWLGNRGRIVRRILNQAVGNNFFVGDNAGRLAKWPTPSEFRFAMTKKMLILPGSDPLPFAKQETMAGSYGVVIETSIDQQNPFADLRKILLDREFPIAQFGRREGLWPFLVNQISMQLRKFA